MWLVVLLDGLGLFGQSLLYWFALNIAEMQAPVVLADGRLGALANEYTRRKK